MADTQATAYVTGPQRREIVPRGRSGRMDDEEFASAVKAALEDAADYIDGFVSKDREMATRMYRGEPFGNEEVGRSQFVMTETRDVVLAMLPSLLRIFTSSSEVCTFEPRTADKVEQAEQQTDAVNYCFYNDNDGFSILYSGFKDALIRKSGIFKWRWDEDIEITEYEFTNISDGQFKLLTSDPDVDILEDESRPLPGWTPPMDPMTGQPVMIGGPPPMAQLGAPPGMPPMPPGALLGPSPMGAAPPMGAPPPPMPMPMATPMPMQPPMLHDCRVRRHVNRSKVAVECLPVEEFLVSRTGRDLKTAPLIGHRKIVTYSDLVKMGYDIDEIKEAGGSSDTFVTNTEAQARNPAINSFQQSPDINDESATRVVYNEVYIRIDKDGDGIAELRKVCMVGNIVLHDEVWDEVPMSVLCPDPEPHTAIGNSVADQTMDIQLLMSNIVRNTLDSLAQSIHPRTAVVEGQVNMDDVLNTETGAIVRMRAPGMVQELNTTFVGQNALPIIQWIDQVKAKRTGVVPASAGLDPDVLQSTTKSGVDQTIQGAQERTEMIARLFAETGIKPMMKGIMRLMTKHQDRPRMMRLRGKWVEVDPRVWDADADVITHVALGRGTEQDKLQALNAIAAKQETAIVAQGVDGPLTDLSNLRYTYGKMTELLGYKNVEAFWKPVDMAQVQQQKQANPPPPDPNMLVAQAQQAKVQGELQIDGEKLKLEQQKLQFEAQKAQLDHQQQMAKIQVDAENARYEAELRDQRERDKARLDAVLKLQIAELQYGTQVQSQQTEAELAQAGLLADVAKHRDSLERADMQHVIDTHADVAKHRMTIDQKHRAAELAAQAKRAQGNGSAATE